MMEHAVRARLGPTGRQVVEILVDRGYHPDTIVARAGVPLRLVFRRTDADACSERVTFSSPHFDRRLAATGPTSIELPPQPPGEVRFTCEMGRYRGRIELVEEMSPSVLTRLRERASHIESPLGTALVLWICTLPLIALAGVLAVGTGAALAAAGAALVACVVGCLWASGRTAEPTQEARVPLVSRLEDSAVAPDRHRDARRRS